MHEPTTEPFKYATLIDLGFDPNDPEILLELGMTREVDWDGADGAGDAICGRLDFVLTVDHMKVGGEPIGIRCVYARTVKDHGIHRGLHVYVLALRPAVGERGRGTHRIALETAVNEARSLRGRSWCADIGQVRISWRHAPREVIALDNGAFEPETAPTETPRASDDEISRMCDAFDAFCDEVDPHAAPIIVLDESDIEYIHHRPPAVPRFASLLN